MNQTATSKRKKRKGATAVEMALVLPIVFAFFFGLWEWSRVEMVRHVSETACFEAARVAILPGKTIADAQQAANVVFDRYFVSGPTITCAIGQGNLTATVDIAVPLDQNTWIMALYYQNKHIHTSLSLTQ